jgi:DNA-binding LacI/PurR family transcriptional regulator
MASSKRLVAAGAQGVTSYDVAQQAGVSQSAVSRSFREGASVAPATRRKVLRTAAELGYAPNAIAQGLITRRSSLVAVLISHSTNLYYPEALNELTERLNEKGMRVLLFTLKSELDVAATLTQVWSHRVEGVISTIKLKADALAQVEARGVPLVLYNHPHSGDHVASVCCDSSAGDQL